MHAILPSLIDPVMTNTDGTILLRSMFQVTLTSLQTFETHYFAVSHK